MPSATSHDDPFTFTLPLAEPLFAGGAGGAVVVTGASATIAGAGLGSSPGSSFVVSAAVDSFASALAPAPGFTADFAEGSGFGIGSLRTKSSFGIDTSRPTRSVE